ncbi:hypothetical protein [uncultured Alistipes sp.]|uniref:hypothetical protein n=1 Tax=uncultured Alistipes sp. TaxID=538949 RepID=UPI001F92C3D7|nr:hypothetical protein [uncultured Alistipes sp.]HJC53082.1 hypothetical protein [Candidatus Alistipes merdavium]
MDSPNHTPTPQETQWRASALAPEKLRRQLKRINAFLCCYSVAALAGAIFLYCAVEPFNWGILICMLAPLITLLVVRINIKRLLAGKQPY